MTTLWALTTNKDEFWLRMTLGASPKDGVLVFNYFYILYISFLAILMVPRSVNRISCQKIIKFEHEKRE